MKEKILLLDDNEDLLLITQIILKGQGYEIVLARTVEEAERKIRIHQPALILMDVFICEEDGREFCKQLKANPATAGIRVILMSGDDTNVGDVTSVGDDFLPKPFDYNDLIGKVERQFSAVQQSVP